MQTIKEFCDKYQISCSLKRCEKNHLISDLQNHYKVTLIRKDGDNKKRKMTLVFSTGSGWKQDPVTEDILSCVLSDSQSILGSNFNDWCDSFGYDTDSRKAEQIYKECQKQYIKLCGFLDGQSLKELLEDTENL